MISHRKVEAFRAIVAAGSVSGASERLNTSQPNLSRLLSELEREVGFTLFRRHSKGMTLTPEGSMLFAEVERSFRGLAVISEAAQKIRDMSAVELSIGSISGPLVSVLPRATRVWRETYGDIALRLELHESEALVHMVQSGWMDLALVRSKEQFFDVEVVWTWTLPYVAFAKAGATSIDSLDNVEIPQLKDPLITPGIGYVAARCTDPATGQAVLTNSAIDSFLSLPATGLAEEGLGVTLVEPIMAGYRIEWVGPAVVVRPVTGAPLFELALIAPSGSARSKAGKRFAEMLIAEVDRLVALCDATAKKHA